MMAINNEGCEKYDAFWCLGKKGSSEMCSSEEILEKWRNCIPIYLLQFFWKEDTTMKLTLFLKLLFYTNNQLFMLC